MKATDILMNEHRVIEQVLNCLEKLAIQAERESQLDSQSAREAIAFFQNFADRCHHGKEEGHLFPMLEARGLPQQGGPTGVMLDEHEQGRFCIESMATAVERHSTTDFARHARSYIKLMRQHIQKEDKCLFPIASQILNQDEAKKLLDAFEYVEHAEMGEGVHENYVAMADVLAKRLNIPLAEVQVTCDHCCSHQKDTAQRGRCSNNQRVVQQMESQFSP